MYHTVNHMHDKNHLQLLLPIQPTKLSMHLIFKGFSLEFSSNHSHSCANLDKLILLFSRATFNTVIKATACRNISIQICKTQGKQIVLWAAELTKPSFLWICILCLLLYPTTAVTESSLLSYYLLWPPLSQYVQLLQPDYYATPCISYQAFFSLLAGLKAACAVTIAELCVCLLAAATEGKKNHIQEFYWL